MCNRYSEIHTTDLGLYSMALARSQKGGLVRRLLFDFEWLQEKLSRTSAADLVADFAYLPADRSARKVRDAIRVSAHLCGRNPGQLAGQLWGRLAASKHSSIRRLLAQARRCVPGHWLRPLTASLSGPNDALVRVFTGHQAPVRSVASVPSSARVVSASSDHTLRVWDVDAGTPGPVLQGHQGAVRAVAVFPDGTRAVSVSNDRTLRVWDLGNGAQLHSFRPHEGCPTVVAVSGDGSRIVSGAEEQHELRVWDAATWRLVGTAYVTAKPSRSLAVTHDCRLAVGTNMTGNSAFVCDLTQMKDLGWLAGAGLVALVAITPDEEHAVSASDEGTLLLWNLATRTVVRTISTASAPFRALALMREGTTAVTVSSERALEIWDWARGEHVHAIRADVAQVSGVAITADNRFAVVTSDDDDLLRVYQLAVSRRSRTNPGHRGFVLGLAVDTKRALALSGSADGRLVLWDTHKGRALRTVAQPSAEFITVSPLRAGRRAITGSAQGVLTLWDLRKAAPLCRFEADEEAIMRVVVAPDEQTAFSGAFGGALKQWDLVRYCLVRELRGRRAAIWAMALTPDACWLIVGDADGWVSMFDADTGERVMSQRRHTDTIWSIAMAPDGHRCISASNDHSLVLWDLVKRRIQRRLKGHSAPVLSVVITSDGRQAVSASEDQTLRIWDLNRGTSVRRLVGHQDIVQSVSLARNSHNVVSASRDHTVRVWDLRKGHLLATFFGDSPMYDCQAMRDGRTIVASEQSGRVHILRLESGARTRTRGRC